ncbi:MAG: 30S ribosome-binding factor RbfA [Candidatus Niyogibacteria bacterium]|nr:30S ribosome-binding factor RbfA [Candidatus Niyogibacteria bacterium]
MGGTRKEKLAAELERQATLFFLDRAELPGTVLSVTRVEVSDDLQNVKIFFSVFPEEGAGRILKEVYAAKKDFRYYLAQRINTKFVPKIMLLSDALAKKQQRVEELLEKLK